jgi:subtilisin family serine protease
LFQQAGKADTLTAAVEKLVDMGVSVVASVANDANPFKTPFGACFTSPSKSSKVISVGAINRGDTVAFYSQYGFCTDIFAPGTDIQSAWILDDASTNTELGTSISTAFVSGVAALYLQETPSMTPQEVKARILEDASKGVWLGWFSPNRILSTAALLKR